VRARFLEACGGLHAFFHEQEPAVHLDQGSRRKVLESLSRSEQVEFISLLTAMHEAEARFQRSDGEGLAGADVGIHGGGRLT